MKHVTLSIDVYNRWNRPESLYRVYVDNDLITERNWVWSIYDTVIREHLEVDIKPGIHTIFLEDCTKNTGFIQHNGFFFKNAIVDDVAISSTDQQFQTITFSV